MHSCELVSFITALSCGIAKCYPKEELPLLIAVLSQTAATLATILEADDQTNSVEVIPTGVSVTDIIIPQNNRPATNPSA